jgi:hypothetical protein
VELGHGVDAQVDAPVQQDGDGVQVVAPVHGADAELPTMQAFAFRCMACMPM